MNNIKDWKTFLENRNTLFGIGTKKGVLKKCHRYIRELLNERKLERFDYLLELLKSYNLPYGEYAVFGSAPLAIKGMINDVNDFDVIIKPRSWNFESDNEYRTKDIEFFDNWPGFDVDDLIDNHTFEFSGVLFVYPEKVIEYKRKMNRTKDQDFI